MITVCALCLRASCWQGVVQCPTSLEIKTGTVEMTREQLLALDREHPSYWGEEAEPPPPLPDGAMMLVGQIKAAGYSLADIEAAWKALELPQSRTS